MKLGWADGIRRMGVWTNADKLDEPDPAIGDPAQLYSLTPHGREALEAVQRHRPQIAFLDIRMPGVSGLEVARTASAVGTWIAERAVNRRRGTAQEDYFNSAERIRPGFVSGVPEWFDPEPVRSVSGDAGPIPHVRATSRMRGRPSRLPGDVAVTVLFCLTPPSF